MGWKTKYMEISSDQQFILHGNTLNYTTVRKLFVLDRNTLNDKTVCKLFVLVRNTLNYTQMRKIIYIR